MNYGWLLAITFADGTVKRFNSYGRRGYVYDGQAWSAYPGFAVSGYRESLSDAPTIQVMRGLSNLGPITFTEAVSGLAAGALVDLMLHNFITFESHTIGSKWRVSTIETTREGQVSFEIVSLERRTKQLHLNVFSPPCKWHLGGYGCEKDLAAFTKSFTVATVADALTFTTTAMTDADNYFAQGAASFLTGAAAGMKKDIRASVLSTKTIKLESPLPVTLAPGDTLTAHAGCDKTDGAAGCARFSNFARRFAHGYLPDENLNWPVMPDPGQAEAPEEEGGIWG
jgi:uncharacterized phage protein (TIGR02218 family)